MAEHLLKALEEQKEGDHNGEAEPEGMFSPLSLCYSWKMIKF